MEKPANYEQYFNTAKTSIFRFEGLQDYSAMDGEDMVRSFILTGKLSTHPSESKWWQDMLEKNKNGIKTARVRLVTLPLNDYTKMELAWHKEAAAYSGDDIRIIEKEKFQDIFMFNNPLSDFWLIDDKYAFKMTYSFKGKFLSDEQVQLADLQKYIDYKEKLIENSISIKNY